MDIRFDFSKAILAYGYPFIATINGKSHSGVAVMLKTENFVDPVACCVWDDAPQISKIVEYAVSVRLTNMIAEIEGLKIERLKENEAKEIGDIQIFQNGHSWNIEIPFTIKTELTDDDVKGTVVHSYDSFKDELPISWIICSSRSKIPSEIEQAVIEASIVNLVSLTGSSESDTLPATIKKIGEWVRNNFLSS